MYFDCGVQDEESSDLAARSRSGEDDSINPDYFWRAQQQAAAESEDSDAGTGTTGGSGGTFTTLEFLRCLDVDLGVLTTADSEDCETECDGIAECAAYSFTTNEAVDNCKLKPSCEIRTGHSKVVSGTKDNFVDPGTGGPSNSGSQRFFQFSGSRCTPASANIRSITNVWGLSGCEALCDEEEECVAYLFRKNVFTCTLKSQCSDLVEVTHASHVSGIKKTGGR